MKKYLETKMWPLIVMAIMICVSCSDDDNNENNGPNHKTNIVGEWYSDHSSSDKILRTVIRYESDGTYHFETIISSKKEGVNEKFSISSTYTINNNVLKESGFGDDESEIETYNIIETNKYTMTLFYDKTQDTEIYHRIIDTYDIERGNVLSYDTSNIDFTPISFTTSDSCIVSVAENGEMKAVKRGTAYITMKSASEAAVIKVNVKDGNKVTDDYSDKLNLSKQEIINQFGNQYFMTNEGSLITYYTGDWEIKEVGFFFNDFGKVETIIVEYWQDIDMNAIDESLQKTYQLMGSDDNNSIFYSSNASFDFLINCDKQGHLVCYKKQLSEFEYFDSFKNMTADKIAEAIGYTITEEDDGIFYKTYYGDYFDNITVDYDNDTKEVRMILLRCVEGISPEDIEPWYKDNYATYVDQLGYCEREDWWNMTPAIFVKISVNSRNGRTYVTYAKF